jgi:hypothetical protein
VLDEIMSGSRFIEFNQAFTMSTQSQTRTNPTFKHPWRIDIELRAEFHLSLLTQKGTRLGVGPR